MTVTMRTEIGREAVRYAVSDAEGREVWQAVVPFGQRERYLAGGPAFTEAARKQEAVALLLVTPAGELTPL